MSYPKGNHFLYRFRGLKTRITISGCLTTLDSITSLKIVVSVSQIFERTNDDIKLQPLLPLTLSTIFARHRNLIRSL